MARMEDWLRLAARMAPYGILGLLYLGALTNWTWNVFGFDRLSLGAGYDSLADSLLRGQVLVDPRHIRPEAIFTPRGAVMYFGIFPALLRVIGNFLMPSMWGRWTALSTAAACVLAVWGFTRGARIALSANPDLSARWRAAFLWASFVTLALGSPVLHLVAASNIYFESIAWAFAGTMAALSFLTGALLSGDFRARTMVGFGAFACVASLARPTYGVPLWLVAGLLLWLLVRRPAQERSWRAMLALVMPLVATFLVLGWYNAARWGSPFVFVDLTGYVQRESYEFVLAQGQWNPHRIATGFFNYFTVSPRHFLSAPPYVRLILPVYLNPTYFSEFRQGFLSIPVSAPWLLPTAIGGIVLTMHRGPRQPALLAAVSLLATQIVLICGFYHIAHRYSLEIYPTLVFAYFYFLAFVPASRLTRAVALEIVLLVFLSVAINALSQINWLVYTNGQTSAVVREALHKTFPGR
jgi:hypothetical protein